METIFNIFNWGKDNWPAIMAALLLGLRFAESIAQLTPTDKDNKLIATIKNFFKFN